MLNLAYERHECASQLFKRWGIGNLSRVEQRFDEWLAVGERSEIIHGQVVQICDQSIIGNCKNSLNARQSEFLKGSISQPSFFQNKNCRANVLVQLRIRQDALIRIGAAKRCSRYRNRPAEFISQ